MTPNPTQCRIGTSQHPRAPSPIRDTKRISATSIKIYWLWRGKKRRKSFPKNRRIKDLIWSKDDIDIVIAISWKVNTYYEFFGYFFDKGFGRSSLFLFSLFYWASVQDRRRLFYVIRRQINSIRNSRRPGLWANFAYTSDFWWPAQRALCVENISTAKDITRWQYILWAIMSETMYFATMKTYITRTRAVLIFKP